MPGTNEAVSRVKIDAQLRDQGWDVLDINAVRFEYVLPDKTKADYVLCDRNGRAPSSSRRPTSF
jgi:type I restriction enzyme, R subunit